MWKSPDRLPETRSIFIVRKWVGRSGDGVVSFIAKIPDDHARVLSPDLVFDLDVEVLVGCVRDGMFFDSLGYPDDGMALDAILAWTPIPGDFLAEEETARRLAKAVLARFSR